MGRYLYCFFVISFMGVACRNSPASGGGAIAKTDTAKTATARVWVVRDSGMYSNKFLKELYEIKDTDGQLVSLIDSYVVYKGDTAYFPDYFERGKQYSFEAKRNGVDYKLRIRNSTYTGVEFEFRREEDGRVFPYSGLLEIDPGFFYGMGSEEDDADSTSYGVAEYFGTDYDHKLSLSLGIKDGKMLATFKAIANDTLHVASLTDCPTLRSKDIYTGKH